MKHWTHWQFKRWGITVETRWGWDDSGDEDKRVWAPYQTLFSIGRLRLHCFHRGDGDPHPHDHMWDFWTFPLTSYVEKKYSPRGDLMYWELRVVRAWRRHRREAEYRHIVEGRLTRDVSYDGHRFTAPEWGAGRIWTIVWVGEKRREWGFWVDGDTIRYRDEAANCWRSETRPSRFIPWKDYVYGGRR